MAVPGADDARNPLISGDHRSESLYVRDDEGDAVLEWLFHGWTLLLALVTVWIFSTPGGPGMGWFVLFALGWLVLGAVWLARVLVALVGLALRRSRPNPLHLLVAPAVVLVLYGLLSVSAPLRARVEVSRDAMDALARRATAAPRGASPPRRVGLFHAREIERIPGGMRFVVRDGDGLFTFTSGFAYRPSGPPPSVDSGDTYEHISGPWYVWTVGGAAD